jgi:hypothetical protein
MHSPDKRRRDAQKYLCCSSTKRRREVQYPTHQASSLDQQVAAAAAAHSTSQSPRYTAFKSSANPLKKQPTHIRIQTQISDVIANIAILLVS